jgi:hypothetical protein
MNAAPVCPNIADMVSAATSREVFTPSMGVRYRYAMFAVR